MRKPTKLLLAFITLVPLAYVIFLFATLFFHITNLILGIPKRNVLMELFDTLLIIHFGMMLWIVVLTIVYVVHIARNSSLKNEMKAVWVTAVCMGNVFAMPVYWYLQIWRKDH